MTASASPPQEPGPAAPADGGEGGLDLTWAWVAAGLVLLALVWWLNATRAWATPLLVACTATPSALVLAGRAGLWKRVRGIARSGLAVALFVSLFLASGGWAYTYGGGHGLALTLDPPAGAVPSAGLTGSWFHYHFTNTGSDRLRVDPGSWLPNRPPVLHLVAPNGTRIDVPNPPPPRNSLLFGGYPDGYVELGPGESLPRVVAWPPPDWGLGVPDWPTGNYTAYLTWSETDCSQSWLPCFVGDLRSNDVQVEVV